MSESTCIEPLSPSKSVTKVQKLCNLSVWNGTTAVLKDYLKCFFSKKTTFLHIKKELPTRKRVIILTPDDVLLVYETNCTGYSFDVRSAINMKTCCNGRYSDYFEKTCTVTLKYKFGCVNLVLMNSQISVWRRTISTVFEGDPFDRSLLTDLSLYTAKDDPDDESFYATRSGFEYTDSAISLKSAHACIDISSPCPSNILSVKEIEQRERINSNRSLTLVASSTALSCSSTIKLPSNDPVSIRRGSRCVSYLAKKFEEKLGSVRKRSADVPKEEKIASSPLEILFPPPVPMKVREEDLKSLREEKSNVEVSKFDFTPSKKEFVNEDVLIID